MILRENYFGDFTNFTTLSEYMSKKERGIVGDPVVQKGPVSHCCRFFFPYDGSMTALLIGESIRIRA